MNEKDANALATANGTEALREHFDRSVALRQHMDKATKRPSTKPPRFPLVPFDQLHTSRALAYCIKGIFPRTGLCVVWGPPKCGKSFWTLDAVLHFALGWTYRGRKVTSGHVVYCAFEGQEGYGNRIEAFRQRHDVPARVPFSLMPARMDLVKDHPLFIGEVAAQLGCQYDAKTRTVTGDKRPAIIVLDTLNRSLNGSETDDMGAYVRAADALRAAFDCLVVIIHHCGVEGSRPRGHTSLTGAADAQIAVKRDAGNIVATLEWMKDGAEGATIVSRLDVVTVGTDDDGDEITTCVIEPVEGDAVPATTTAPKRKLSDRQKLALDALGGCVLDQGKDVPAAFGLPSGVKAVPIEVWRTELFARGVLDHDAPSPREDYRRVKTSLQARQLIGERDGLVWKAAP